MRHFFIMGLLLLSGAASLRTQDATGLIRGVVVDSLERPALAEIRAQVSNGQERAHIASTGPDGLYRLEDLRPDTYDLVVSAIPSYESVVIKSVQLGLSEVKTLPPIQVELGIFACNTDRQPTYYRLSSGAPGTGAVGGIVMNEENVGIGKTTVTLYRKGKGAVSSTSTDEVGRFGFSGVEISREEHWITIAHTGYFLEELRHLRIRPGFESVYAPIMIESCSPGRCQPHLKAIRVLRC